MSDSRTLYVSPDIPIELISNDRQWNTDTFQFICEIYHGHSSRIYVIIDRQSSMKLILKVYMKSKLGKYVKVCDVLEEIENHRQLKHENIIELYAAFEDSKYYCLVLERGNDDLFGLLKRELPEDFITEKIIKPLLDAVEYLHDEKRIIHRDIKPENILYCGKTIKLADFGLSINYSRNRPTTPCGTLSHMAPEILVCQPKRYCKNGIPEPNSVPRKSYSVKVDVWSIGVLACELLTGSTPYKSGTLNDTMQSFCKSEGIKLPTSVTPEAKDFIWRALTISESKRATIQELKNHPWILGASAFRLKLPRLRSVSQTWSRTSLIDESMQIENDYSLVLPPLSPSSPSMDSMGSRRFKSS